MADTATLDAARDLVESFLEASMVPDPDRAATFLADNVTIFFTGATEMSHPREMTAYNKNRYSWVKKKFGRFDVADAGDHVVVYSVGTLYGEWLDGEPFSGNRYVDRFEIRNGQITRIDVWNDSAERLLKAKAGLASASA